MRPLGPRGWWLCTCCHCHQRKAKRRAYDRAGKARERNQARREIEEARRE